MAAAPAASTDWKTALLRGLIDPAVAASAADRAPARVGEDEFAIIVPKTASHTSYRVRDALEQPLRVAGFDIYPTVSIGAASAEGGPDAADPSELLRQIQQGAEAPVPDGQLLGAVENRNALIHLRKRCLHHVLIVLQRLGRLVEEPDRIG